MNLHRMACLKSRRNLRLVLTTAVIAIGATSVAQAAIVLTKTDTDFSTSPTTISLGGGAATYTFSYLNDGYTADAVSTGGTALVNSSSFPGPGQQPIPFELGTNIGYNGYNTFTAFPTPAGIDYSIAEDFIGLEFQLNDGNHFGYAEVLGPTLVGYAYNSTPNGGIEVAAVPEPATWAMMLLGFGGMGFMLRSIRRKQEASAVTA